MNWLQNKTLKSHWFSQKISLGLLLLLGWFASIGTFGLSLMTGWYFDLIYHESISKSSLLENFGLKIHSIKDFFLLMGGIVVLKVLIHFYERNELQKRAERFNSNLIRRLYYKQINWENELFRSVPFGKYLLRYSGDLQPIKGMLTNGIHRGAKEMIFLFSGLVLLLYLNASWTLSLLFTGLLITPLIWLIDQNQNPWIVEKRTKKSLLLNYVTNTFAKHYTYTNPDQKTRVIRKFREKNRQVLESNIQYQTWESLRLAWLSITGPLLIFGLLGSITLFPATKGSPGELLAFLLVIGSLIPAVRNLAKVPSFITKGMLSLTKIERLIRKRKRIPNIPEANMQDKVHQSIKTN